MMAGARSSRGAKLAERVLLICEERARMPVEIAKKAVMGEKLIDEPVRSALVYFFNETWHGTVHPAMISLACEAVGGDPVATDLLGAAVVLLSGAADLHDDIIDQSTVKGRKPTVLAKYGKDLTLLSGDALLFRGMILLNDSFSALAKRQKIVIEQLVTKAFFKLVCAESKETQLRGMTTSPENMMRIIRMKASVAEANMKMGAIVGGGSPQQVEVLGRVGKDLGLLTTMRDEFVDMYEPAELRNRFVNEVLPVPVIYAVKDRKKRGEICALLDKDNVTENDSCLLVSLVMKNVHVRKLILQMEKWLEEANAKLEFIDKSRATRSITLALRATMEDLRH